MQPYCYNIILAGQHGVGKTKIFQKLKTADDAEMDNRWPTPTDPDEVEDVFERDRQRTMSHTSTSGKSVRGWDKWTVDMESLNGDNVKVILWDTAGMERTGVTNVTHSYFSVCCAAVLVYSTAVPVSLHELQKWVERIKDETTHDTGTLVFSLWINDKEGILNEEDSTVKHFMAHHGIPEDLVFTVSLEEKRSCLVLHNCFQKVVDSIHLKATQKPQCFRDEDDITVSILQSTSVKNAPNSSCAFC